MNNDLMEQLLNEDESATLDFKRDQYLFDGATDNERSELLKDILAFANAWRRTDAYILIGVKEVRGGRSIPVGVMQHLVEHTLQQFINSKTQRPITFSYSALQFESVQIGVIKIPVQSRPFFLKQDYGKLKKHVVYLRRGSATVEADPEEISKMGASLVHDQQPTLDLQFADVRMRRELGTSIDLVSEIVKLPPEDKIPLLNPSPWSAASFMEDQNYYRKLAYYIARTSFFNPVGFALRNTSSVLISNARLRITSKIEAQVRIVDSSDYPSRPGRRIVDTLSLNVPNFNNPVSVDVHGKEWTLSARFGSVQPKDVAGFGGVFYIGANSPSQLNLEAQIFADNLSDPIKIPLVINIQTKTRELDIKELREYDS